MADIIHIANDINEPKRLSEYLKCKLKFSSSLITRVKFGGVKLNGEVVTMRAQVCRGDTVEVSFPKERSENIEPCDYPLDIVFEDDDILVVNKPKNMPTHPSRGNHLVTLANAVMGYLGENFVFRAVTRLDRDTSGLVLIAKNQLAAGILGDEMRSGKIKKHYTALLSGVPEVSSGRIDAPIRRECEGNLKRCVAEDGKRAITDYRVTDVTDGGNAVCEIELLTGRTHQIRVHFAHIGHPLVGDFLYGERSEDTYKLACTRLEFKHPITEKRLSFEIKAPFLS